MDGRDLSRARSLGAVFPRRLASVCAGEPHLPLLRDSLVRRAAGPNRVGGPRLNHRQSWVADGSPSHPVPAPSPGPTRPGSLKSNFLCIKTVTIRWLQTRCFLRDYAYRDQQGRD